MPPILAVRELRKSWSGTLVLENADFLIQEGEKVALVGPNGAGKSTLFKLLAWETKPDVGGIVMKPELRFGYLPQIPNLPEETPVRGVLSAPSPEVQRIEAELVELETWMARPDAWDAPDASARMARYESLHVALGGARSRSVIVNDPILNDLGVEEELLEQTFGTLSGGEKSKVLTARALANAQGDPAGEGFARSWRCSPLRRCRRRRNRLAVPRVHLEAGRSDPDERRRKERSLRRALVGSSHGPPEDDE